MKILQWFRKAQKVKKLKASLSKESRAGFSLNGDFVYNANGIEFVGCYLGYSNDCHQFAISTGVLSIGENADISVVRSCTKKESAEIKTTKSNVASSKVVTFLLLNVIAA